MEIRGSNGAYYKVFKRFFLSLNVSKICFFLIQDSAKVWLKSDIILSFHNKFCRNAKRK